MHHHIRFGLGLVALSLLAACGEESGRTAGQVVNEAPWAPSVVYRSSRAANPRGLLDRRGLIHAHSHFSHDACDNQPVKDGQRDPVCFDDFRRGLCQSQHDFAMLTDHRDAFAEYEYPDVLLYRAERGDRLVNRRGKPVASWAACSDGSAALILAGTESGFMPVGLEEHVDGSIQQRGEIYSARTPASIEATRNKGAVVLLQHTEDWTPTQLATLPVDGFEMYNVHANLLRNPGPALELLLRLEQGDPQLPHSDLILLPIFQEDLRYLSRWGTVLSQGVKRVTTMGTDCHRNTFTAILPDGERGDSYRRMMTWFSNHLLVRPDANGQWDDQHLKEALRAGRLYGAFEMLGYPQGFDYRAETSGNVSEMGSEVALGDRPTLRITAPLLRNLNPLRQAPEIKVRLLRAIDGGFEIVRDSATGFDYAPSLSGAYRVEIRMVPLHLRQDLGRDADKILNKEYVWIYSNPIYVR